MEEVFLGGGCFWGIQHLISKLKGVIETEVGYMGGNLDNPCYRDICRKKTGHVEVVRVVFNQKKIGFVDIVKYFFEIHDPTQKDRQGVDHGSQYHSTIFYNGTKQKKVIEKVIKILERKERVKVQTTVIKAEEHKFWKGEEYHQDYFVKKHSNHVCHMYRKKF